VKLIFTVFSRETSEAMRTFIAVELQKDVQNFIGEYIDSLKNIVHDVNWVRPENLHITIKFLGEIPDNIVNKITEAISKTASGYGPFSLVLSNLGFFPSVNAARVVWIGADGGIDHLLDFFHDLENNLEAIGFDRESRTFSPHLTIGRVKKDKKAKIPDKFPEFGQVRFDVKGIALIKSKLTPTGPIYEKIYEGELTQPPMENLTYIEHIDHDDF